MFSNPSPLRIAVYGSDVAAPGRGVGLWSIGYRGAVTAAGATPVLLQPSAGMQSWNKILEGCKGVVACGHEGSTEQGDLESLCIWCKQHKFPILAIDRGLLALNSALGGANYNELSRELPEALQHRHPPEKGLRHAINVVRETYLADLYGEGEVAVNSEHRRGISRLARGFRVSATALDSVVEAIEFEGDRWYAMGVQWRPASASASGLDIQVFRGVINACQKKTQTPASEVSFEAA